mgnify:CR=1 FL=1|tara:strand:- start:700 stop:1440 length:741 start_codon:yes stop_codon:yes gene_type:complete
MKKKPLITIITVCKNSQLTIERTIKSVINQKYKNIEYLIIDGKSEDNTLPILKKYKSCFRKVISEKDKGIYDAFNKGLKFAKGDLIGFVNSDDTLKLNALKILVKYYNKFPDKDFYFGSVKKKWGIIHGYKPWLIHFSWGFYTSHSTGFFIKRNAAKKVGKYNLKYKYSADYDYFYRMIVKNKLNGIATKKNEIFGVFKSGGFSSKVNFLEHLYECTKIRIDNKQPLILVSIIFIIKLLYNIRRIF